MSIGISGRKSPLGMGIPVNKVHDADRVLAVMTIDKLAFCFIWDKLFESTRAS